LTDFVREHMLEAFPVEPRIEALINHFDNLNRAHEAVVKAKQQIEKLTPLIRDCDNFAELATHAGTLRDCRDALQPWFASLKSDLLQKRLANLEAELARLSAQIDSLDERRGSQQGQRDS